jgi:tetratricopeptide (TPR) repeat protein
VAATRAGIAFGLAALTLAVFVQIRHHDFVAYDDYLYVSKNPHVTSGLSWQSVKEAFTRPYRDQWMPLTRISLQLSYELHGDDATSYLLTNVALHLLSTLLLFFALASMSEAVWCSAFVAAVFAVHPLHVESVAWASARKDVLSALFCMLTFAAYARHAEQTASKAGYALVLIFLTLGLLAKPTLVTLPCVLLLLDYWPLGRLRRREDLRGALVEKLPLFALAALACGVTVVVQRAGGSLQSLEIVPLAARILNAVDSYLVYIAESFWPSGLAVFYPHPLDTLPVARVVAEGILLLALTGAAVALRRSRPYLLVGWLWYVGMLVPVIGFVQVGMQARADRYMYLPLIGLSIMLAWGAVDLARGRLARRVLALGGAGAVAALAVAAWVQVGYWRDSITLFERDLAVTLDNSFAHRVVGTLHLRAERFEQAEYHYTRAFELAPEEGRASLVRFNIAMGDRLAGHHDFDAALARYQEAVRIDPEHARANGLLGLALVASHRLLEARPHLETALREQPGNSRLHAAMAAVASAEGKLAEAVEYNREALRLEPTLRSARNNLAWLLATSPEASLRDPAEALRLAEGLRDETREPGANLLDTLAAAYAAAGRFDEAVRSAEQAAALAEAEGDLALAQTIRKQTSSYRSRKPYTAAYPSADPSSGLPSSEP